MLFLVKKSINSWFSPIFRHGKHRNDETVIWNHFFCVSTTFWSFSVSLIFCLVLFGAQVTRSVRIARPTSECAIWGRWPDHRVIAQYSKNSMFRCFGFPRSFSCRLPVFSNRHRIIHFRSPPPPPPACPPLVYSSSSSSSPSSSSPSPSFLVFSSWTVSFSRHHIAVSRDPIGQYTRAGSIYRLHQGIVLTTLHRSAIQLRLWQP